MQYFVNLLFAACLCCRIFLYIDDNCTSDLCRHAFQLGVDQDETRIEILPYLIYGFSKSIFYFGDLLIIYPAYKLIKDPVLALLVIIWFVQPSYDSWALVPIIYSFMYPRRRPFFALIALFIKFKILFLAYISYLANRLTYLNQKFVISRGALIFIAVILAMIILMASGYQLQAEGTRLVGRDNLFLRILIYLASPVSSHIALDNDMDYYSNLIRWQNYFISVVAFIGVIKYRVKFFYLLSAIIVASVVDFIQIRYFLYFVTIALIFQFFNLKFIKSN